MAHAHKHANLGFINKKSSSPEEDFLYNGDMIRYFDRTFFHFLFGFIGMIGLSMLVLVLVGYYETEVKANQQTQSTNISFSQD